MHAIFSLTLIFQSYTSFYYESINNFYTLHNYTRRKVDFLFIFYLKVVYNKQYLKIKRAIVGNNREHGCAYDWCGICL